MTPRCWGPIDRHKFCGLACSDAQSWRRRARQQPSAGFRKRWMWENSKGNSDKTRRKHGFHTCLNIVKQKTVLDTWVKHVKILHRNMYKRDYVLPVIFGSIFDVFFSFCTHFGIDGSRCHNRVLEDMRRMMALVKKDEDEEGHEGGKIKNRKHDEQLIAEHQFYMFQVNK